MMMISTLLYGSDTWTPAAAIEKTINWHSERWHTGDFNGYHTPRPAHTAHGTHSEVQSRTEGWIGETDNLLKIVRSSSGLDASTDKQVHWPNGCCGKVWKGQGRDVAMPGTIGIATSQSGPGRDVAMPGNIGIATSQSGPGRDVLC